MAAAGNATAPTWHHPFRGCAVLLIILAMCVMIFWPDDPELKEELQQTTVHIRKEPKADVVPNGTPPQPIEGQNEPLSTALPPSPTETTETTPETTTTVTTTSLSPPTTASTAATSESQPNPGITQSPPSASSNNNQDGESLKFCQSTSITAIDGSSETFPHACQGPLYQHVTQQLQAFAADQSYRRSKIQPLWGKRMSLPSSFHKILWYGSDQLLQIVQSLVCQQQHSILSMAQSSNDDHVLFRYTSTTTTTDATKNQQELWALVNSSAPFSPEWLKLTEQQLEGQVLETFDAIVFGPVVVTCSDKDATDCSAQTSSVPVLTLSTLAKHFTKPIIYITAWDNRNDISVFFDLQAIETAQPQRKNVHFLPSRRYMEAIKENDCWAESSSSSSGLDASNTVSDCNPKQGNLVCTGTHGSHADLVLWDVLEILQKYDSPI